MEDNLTYNYSKLDYNSNEFKTVNNHNLILDHIININNDLLNLEKYSPNYYTEDKLLKFINNNLDHETYDVDLKLTKKLLFSFINESQFLDISLEDSKYLKKKLFNFEESPVIFDTEVIEINDSIIEINDSIIEINNEIDLNYEEENDEFDINISYNSNIDETVTIREIAADEDKKLSNIVKISDNIILEESKPCQKVTPNISSIFATDDFTEKRDTFFNEKEFTKNLKKAKKLKETINEIFGNISKQKDIIEKKVIVLNYLKKLNVGFEIEDFDYTDINNLKIITDADINLWYEKIVEIDAKKNKIFDISFIILMSVTYGIEFLAEKFNIEEFQGLTSLINESTLSNELSVTKNYIDENLNIPNNPILNYIMFIFKIYIRKKIGLLL